jgi:hypothetical protein
MRSSEEDLTSMANCFNCTITMAVLGRAMD